jgi:hypothetical protein
MAAPDPGEVGSADGQDATADLREAAFDAAQHMLSADAPDPVVRGILIRAESGGAEVAARKGLPQRYRDAGEKKGHETVVIPAFAGMTPLFYFSVLSVSLW